MVSEKAEDITIDAVSRGIYEDYSSLMEFSNDHWESSSVSIPDSILQKQYNQEIYRLGTIVRENSYPIS